MEVNVYTSKPLDSNLEDWFEDFVNFQHESIIRATLNDYEDSSWNSSSNNCQWDLQSTKRQTKCKRKRSKKFVVLASKEFSVLLLNFLSFLSKIRAKCE